MLEMRLRISRHYNFSTINFVFVGWMFYFFSFCCAEILLVSNVMRFFSCAICFFFRFSYYNVSLRMYCNGAWSTASTADAPESFLAICQPISATNMLVTKCGCFLNLHISNKT